MEVDVFHKFYYLGQTLLTDKLTAHAIQNQAKRVVQGWSLQHRDWDPAEDGGRRDLWMASENMNEDTLGNPQIIETEFIWEDFTNLKWRWCIFT